MDHPQGVLRTGDRATVQFEFISHPEFIKEGMKLLFREGKTKACSANVLETHLTQFAGAWCYNAPVVNFIHGFVVSYSLLRHLFLFSPHDYLRTHSNPRRSNVSDT
jgi:hypothetical protein